MTHTAKKICAGEYEYRGWAISKVWSDWSNCDEWFINATDHMAQGRSYFDPVATLKFAKLAIDEAIADGDAVEV